MLVWDEIVGARVVSFSYLVVSWIFRPKDAINVKYTGLKNLSMWFSFHCNS